MNKISLLFLISIFFTSCGKEEPILLSIEAMIITNLHAPTTSNPGEPPAGEYIKFSFKKQKTASMGGYLTVNLLSFITYVTFIRSSQ